MIELIGGPGKAIDNYTIEIPVLRHKGVYLYIQYIRGTEDYVQLTFSVKPATTDPTFYTLVERHTDGTIAPFTVILNEEGNFLLSIPIPDTCSHMRVHTDYPGGEKGEGTVKIFVELDSTEVVG